MEDVKQFFAKFYNPSNAILCIAGNFELATIKEKVNYWFADIPKGLKPPRILPKEPVQNEFRALTIERKVPANAFYYAFKMAERKSPEYYITDLLSDYLGSEKSSNLYISLKKEQKLVAEINTYITGSIDEGMLIISGKLNDGVTFESLDEALWKELQKATETELPEKELNRLKIKLRTAKEFQEQGLLNRAMNLSYFELLGDANGVNEEQEIYQQITSKHLAAIAKKLLVKKNCSLLKVKAIANAE
jgi:predicted Zn-dependent peptidase